VTNTGILQLYRVHQMMKSHVGIAATQTREQGRHQSRESDHWVAAECAEQEIEPDYIRLEPMQRLQETKNTARIVERPAAQDAEARLLDMRV
jgi:hypothetical protein